MRLRKRALKKVCTQDRLQQQITDYSKLDVKPCLVVAFTFPILLALPQFGANFLSSFGEKVRLKQTCQTRMGSTDVDVNGERDGLDSNLPCPLMFQKVKVKATYKVWTTIASMIFLIARLINHTLYQAHALLSARPTKHAPRWAYT